MISLKTSIFEYYERKVIYVLCYKIVSQNRPYPSNWRKRWIQLTILRAATVTVAHSENGPLNYHYTAGCVLLWVVTGCKTVFGWHKSEALFLYMLWRYLGIIFRFWLAGIVSSSTCIGIANLTRNIVFCADCGVLFKTPRDYDKLRRKLAAFPHVIIPCRMSRQRRGKADLLVSDVRLFFFTADSNHDRALWRRCAYTEFPLRRTSDTPIVDPHYRQYDESVLSRLINVIPRGMHELWQYIPAHGWENLMVTPSFLIENTEGRMPEVLSIKIRGDTIKFPSSGQEVISNTCVTL